MKSKLFSISSFELVKAAILSGISAALSPILIMLNSSTGTYTFDWPHIKKSLLVAFFTALVYIIQKLFSNSQDRFLRKEPTDMPPTFNQPKPL